MKILRIAAVGMAMAFPPIAGAQAKEAPQQALTKAVAALAHADQMDGRGAVVEAHDGDQFVQCRRAPHEPVITCEAAGPRGQPWMRHALSKKRRANLKELGYVSDRKTGNFVARLDPSQWPNDKLAGFMVATLVGGYDVGLEDIETETGSYPAVACPPRNPSGRDFGGEVAFNDRSPKDLGENCEVAGMDDEDESRLPKPLKSIPMEPDAAESLVKQNVKEIADAYTWLLGVSGPGRRVVILSWGEFHIQCSKTSEPVIPCEIESAEANPALRRVITAAVGHKLNKMGFREPGFSKNYVGWFRLNDGKPENWAWSTMQAALTAFGGYAIQPVAVERRVTKGET
ncbi:MULTISPECIES: hypothetical protein [Nitrospirillum]|uniref:Uncharacterized protein n=1 Tax=Nitrospirillum amazonense TaxID=28077 RepID=A0A560EWM2_9PROT|nr:hypothetical protein [Nitrospirillum amazonense]MEC4594513.1 hypothetical protein [Nitrospirillum amazonense]TWB13772.1 hypothetical protein FBZ88_13524 [Nitrospirillum amazonense]